MRRWRRAGSAFPAALLTAAACLLLPAPASAADDVVATVERATPVDAFGGHAVWSAWDPSARAYRLVEFAGAATRVLPVAPASQPFDVDLGPDARGGVLAVYSRCRRPPDGEFAVDGRRGCDLYAYELDGSREFRIPNANSGADERWPTVWRSRLAFTRTYEPRGGRSRRLLYWRPFNGPATSRRLDRGPTRRGDAVAEQLDLNSRRVAFVWRYEYGAELRLDTTTGSERRLVALPGSGAAVNVFSAQGPAIVGGDVFWALSVGADAPVFTELRSFDLGRWLDTRATELVSADPSLPRATEGHARDGSVTWYVRAAAAGTYEIHRVTGLEYVPAPLPPFG